MILDAQFWMMVFAGLTLIGVILSHVHQRLVNQKLMNNHLHHVDLDLQELKKEIKSLKDNDKLTDDKISQIQSDVSYLVGYYKGKDKK